ncbi:four-helix bundle copper-binding protein [Altererythrobacter sp. H2]|uniref:four-helix bundle copper-binding protein n=1 Tax=Altererythrobacter sp. H2 TaxID=3108391 RepID=UPI002B4BB9E3|nr:four-helix bundle copper-binding protein [Altererythrobacter sp. H2]WRK96736.1 four-helix bundle copper-binding protein [Altererythrobacter sp. H2]
MSIVSIIAAHPDLREGIGGPPNEALAQAAAITSYCSVVCTSCADACAAEEMDMQQCIRTCSDCADICAATSRVAARRTGANEEVLRSMLNTCIQACELCAAECEQHDNDHCRICAEACRDCAARCREALQMVG